MFEVDFCFRYFFKLRVVAKDDGEEKLPKRQTAEAIKSHIKKTIQEKYKLVISDPCVFPEMEKKWKAFVAELVDKGRNKTDHHEEVEAQTFIKIHNILMDVMVALKARGTPEYEVKLSKIPAEYHGSLHKIP